MIFLQVGDRMSQMQLKMHRGLLFFKRYNNKSCPRVIL